MKHTLAIVLVLAVACGHSEQRPESTPTPVKVQTITLQPQRVPETYEVVGTVRPKTAATISAKVMAIIQSIPVKPGDTVKAGDVLAQLDDREVRAEFERAEADYGRFKKLVAEGVVPTAEFQSVEERYRVARAALSYATIAAPFDGIVTEKLADAGDLATPGKPLFTVEQPTQYRLEAYVPERFVVPVGTKIGGEFGGIVAEVVPASDPSSRSFLIKVDLQTDRPLRSGMFGRAEILTGERTGLFAPKSAVHERGQLTIVDIARDGRAWMRLVKTGASVGDQVELLSGVEPGERLIISAGGELTDGGRVSE